MPCSSLSSAAVRALALVQTCRQKGCDVCHAAHDLLLLKQEWLSKDEKDKTVFAAAFRGHSTLVACLLSTACPDTICMARYGILQQAH